MRWGLLCCLLPCLASAEVTSVAGPRLDVAVDDSGALTIRHKPTGRIWRSEPAGGFHLTGGVPAVSRARLVPGGLSYRRTLATGARAVAADLTVTTDQQADAVTITLDLPDRRAAFETIMFPEPLTAELAAGQLCLTPYSNGLLLPETDTHLLGRTFTGAGLDLPWIGYFDAERGDGYALVLDTPFDGLLKLVRATDAQGRPRQVPQAGWLPEMGRFGYPRKLTLLFVESGGYVALAKRYRALARREGLLVTLREKALRRPAIARLAGAPDVWAADLAWAEEARRRGVKHCLINTTESGEKIARLNELGFLTSKYDNYVDLLIDEDEAKWDQKWGPAKHIVITPTGERMKGWLTYDKQTQYYKRSAAVMKWAAERTIPKDLATRPYLARFLDVTTASALYEDHHPEHTLTRTGDRDGRVALFEYVNSLGLVTGGEHGRFWGVPTNDYFEGLMSANHYFSWPAGHLRHPDEGLAGISDRYRQYGLGPEHRIPLWELVFGDCVVDYWYWGDSTDYLHRFDPTITDRKDAFNVLYGTPPMYWLNHLGFGRDGWDRLLDSYFRTCPWHEQVMFEELLTHESLTDDKLLQRTTFSGDKQALVNFADEPRTVAIAGREAILPPHGFVATGPDFRAERVLTDQQVVLRVTSPRQYVERRGTELVVAGLDGPERLVVNVSGAGRPVRFRPANLAAGFDPATARAWRLEAGERGTELTFDGGELAVSDGASEICWGSLTARPDLVVEARWSGGQFGEQVVHTPAAGAALEAVVRVVNRGRAPATPAGLVLRELDDEIWRATVPALAPGAGHEARLTLDPARFDGYREGRLTLVTDQAELSTRNNAVDLRWRVPPAFTRDWQPLLTATVAGARADRPVVAVAAVTLPAGLDPATLRRRDDRPDAPDTPVQFEPDAPGGRTGRLVWLAAENGRYEFGGRATGRPVWFRPRWQATAGATASGAIVAEGYRARFTDGVLGDLARTDRPIAVSELIYSSAVTGWADEPGLTDAFEVLVDGPARTIVRVRRTLAGGRVRYTKTYTFHPFWFTVETRADPSVTGLHNRAYFTARGTYRDSLGQQAEVDGRGDGEGIIGTKPDWVTVAGDGWALTLVPLAPTGGLTYTKWP